MTIPSGMTDKVVLITGGSGGIGKETAKGVARRGATTVIVGRNERRGRQAVAEIQQEAGHQRVAFLAADLSSQAEIRRLAGDFQARYERLDVLINNVGGLYAERWETVDGIEATLAMNLLNPFLLTQLLLPLLKESAPARIVNLTTGGHRMAKLNFDDLQARQWFRGLDMYGQAKLANLLWTYEQARRLEGSGVTVNAADPGGADTSMTQNMTPEMMPWFMRLLWPLAGLMQRFMQTSPEAAAYSSVYAATSPEMESATGKYIHPKGKIVRSSQASYDETAARRIWQICEELTELDKSRVQTTNQEIQNNYEHQHNPF